MMAARYRSAMQPTPASRPSRVSVALLGPVDGEPLAVDTRKAVATLGYLAVTGRPASRESLAALLWPDADETDAKGALRRTLSVLNRALGGSGLTIDRRVAAVDPAKVEVDVLRFREALARVRAHGDPPERTCAACFASLDEAVALDRGGFMAGFALRDSEAFDEWQLAEAEAHQRELAGALERLARGRAASEAWDGAIAAGRRWLALDPLHEPAHRLLMEAHARSGEPGAALAQYRQCVATLARELGVAPLPETTALYESIRGGTLGAVPREPGAPAERDVGAAAGRPATRLPLVGRQALMDEVLAIYRAATPDGRAVVLEGEAGIGKTRLGEEVASIVAGIGGIVLTARCYAGESGIAYGPIVELLRACLARPDSAARVAALPADVRRAVGRLVPSLSPVDHPADRQPSEGPAARARLLDSIATMLSTAPAGAAPGILWLDDVTWADASTLEALGWLLHRLRGRPVLVLLAWRREDLDAAGERFASVIGGLPGVSVVHLERLDRTAVSELVAAAGSPSDGADRADPQVVDALMAESEGLPLYVVEALAGERRTADVPPGVRYLLGQRLAAVSEAAAQILAAGAVLGRSFDLPTVVGTSGRSEEEAVTAIEELLRRGLVREVGGGGAPAYDFAHHRLRDAAYDQTSLARRRLLHRRAADTLRAAGGRDADDLARLALIAGHERDAGRDEAAAEAYRSAGERARRLFANREALGHLEAALALGHPDQVGLRETVGALRMLIGDYPGAIASLETAAAAAADGQQDRLPGIEHTLGRVHLRRGDLIAAESHLSAALAGSTHDTPLRAWVLTDRSVCAHRAGDDALAAVLADEALEMARLGPLPEVEARARQIRGRLARSRGDLPAARAELEASLAIARALTDGPTSIAAHHALALVSAEADDTDGALAHAGEALAECRRIGDLHLEAVVENALADILHAAGREDEAMVHLKRAVALFAEVDSYPAEPDPEIWKLMEW